MKLKTLAVLAVSGVLASSFAFADDSGSSTMGDSMNSSTAGGGGTMSGNVGNVSSNDMAPANSSNSPNQAPAGDSNNNDDMSADTATGDDDY
jgi:hypothetical protein